MMWDFGDQTYVPGSSPPPPSVPPAYPPHYNSYPAYSQESAPYPPIDQPMPDIGPSSYYGPSYAYENPYQSAPPMPRAASEPMNPFAGAVMPRAAPIQIQQTYSMESTHSSHAVHTRERRISNARPHPNKLTHQTKPHADNHTHSHVWGYSKCTGRKKALCIGINYFGQQQELHGCINDAKNVRNFLIRHWGYKADDIVLLTDDSSNSRSTPTRVNILDAMRWLVKDAHQHDSLFFHYSGHGAQVRDRDGDEKDGLDEVILPVDYVRAGYIVDDMMHEIMVHPLPLGCRLTALFDSCHSGSALDLPYLYHSDGRRKGSQVSDRFYEKRSTPADVVSFSGCKDNQTSADTYEAGVAVGAMSYAFMRCLKENPNQTYQELLRSIRKILHDKYDQKPQLSTSHRIDTTLQFIL
ncbi:hypothetical protein BDW22DRAFT_1361639 [Trametopsis cervina]|nr:hypothetical protein BDW22DRAFT_1361639 [Trametopsis cervina]